MKKGVSLRVEVYIEGEAAPADDFAQVGQRVLLEVLAAGMRGDSGPYLLGVKRIEPLDGSDADGDADGAHDADQNTGFIASWSGPTGTSGV